MTTTLKQKRITYGKVFENELGKIVLADLRVFCHATKTTAAKDANQRLDMYEVARLEGRREVFLQIMNTIKVDFDDYYNYEDDYE